MNSSVDSNDIYDPAFVKGVFDRCSSGYRYWSQVASFGFVWLWRRQCIDRLPKFHPLNAVGADLMAGTGETWPHLIKRHPELKSIVAIDISSGMVQRAIDRLHSMRLEKIEIIEADVLKNELQSNLADFAICIFGLKTFNRDQQKVIAGQLARILKPGGLFSFIEASDPEGWILKGVYRFYLRQFLPLIERLFLRGAQDFAMLGICAREFGDCGYFASCLIAEGLEVKKQDYFFGCATGVIGRKP